MTQRTYDLAIIGGGPGGYVAAIRAGQLGMRVACVDNREGPGGTCLHVGCIPSKALLHSSKLFWDAKERSSRHGVVVKDLALDLSAMLGQKDQAVQSLTRGVGHLFRNHRIEHVRGRGRLIGRQRIVVEGADGASQELAAQSIILATGSEPIQLNNVPIDEVRILSSTGALDLHEVPQHLAIIGGGYIGLELGSVWGRLGAQITCFEMMDRLLPAMDGEIAGHLQHILEQQGITFRLQTKVKSAHVEKHVDVSIESVGGDASETLRCSHLLVAVGRKPCVEGLGLEQAGVEKGRNGFITVDRRFRTTAEGIFAVGDVVGEPMLAHKAMDEAVACVEGIAGQAGHIDYDAIPAVVYTWPEVASVGRTEEELRRRKATYRVGRFPYRANSRGRCTGEIEGFVKVLADEETDLILGAHILGPDAGTTIHELAAAIEFGVSVEELGRMTHAHPTVSEAVREAALAVHGCSIHM